MTKIKVHVLFDGENSFYYDDIGDLAQHIAELCDIDNTTDIILETKLMTQAEYDDLPEAVLR